MEIDKASASPIPIDASFDVIVVGASIAGCTAARLYAQEGMRVALIDHHRDASAYKQLCTHYIQASATPTLRRLGLDTLIEQAGGIRNGSEIWTHFGWIGHHPPVDEHGKPLYGYNVQRKTLDPLLRQMTCETPGVTSFLSCSVRDLIIEEGVVKGLMVDGTHQGAIHARLVVAADGRSSGIAQRLGVEPKESTNIRFGALCAYRGVALKRGTCSQMWLNGAEVAYVFPNDDGVTVVAYLNALDQWEEFHRDPVAALEHRMQQLPEGPDLRAAECLGKPLVVKKFTNLWRMPVTQGVCFVGDALMSLDYLWGTGCGFALQQAEWLVDATIVSLKTGVDLDAARLRYAKLIEKNHGMHRALIQDFSKRHDMNWIERLMFSSAVKDIRCARHLHTFGARLMSPMQFISPRAILRAIWVNWTRRSTSQVT
ncbi:MAG TPA: NAD(P)/FAD-dependent oxidoreductase [Burkholderiaceae bacterium]|jgi:flavin-dependent dehydrogenase